MDFLLGYREVIPDQTLPEQWKEITLNTGGSQSTLQDIKVPEKAGGYSYKNSSNYVTRNRFICWHIVHDVLELVEHSLDVNLVNNRIKYKFTDTPILDGISIHEESDSVIILIATVSSIHKFSFSHPNKIHTQVQILSSQNDITMPSIFSEVSIINVRDPHIFHLIPTTGSTNSPVAYAAASCLVMNRKKALFALAYSSGILLVLQLDLITGLVNSQEFKQESVVPRFLSGIATAFRGRSNEVGITTSLVLHTCSNDSYLITLSREGQLRLWSCKKVQCLAVIDIAESNNYQNIQNHGLRKLINSHNDLYLCTHFKVDKKSMFNILKLKKDNETNAFIRICTIFADDHNLVDFSFTIYQLWAVWRATDMDSVAITHTKLPLSTCHTNFEWESAIVIQSPDKDYIISDSGTDPRQAYISYIFHPGQFSLMDISRALSIYTRSNFIADFNLSPYLLREKVCMSVESDIQAEVMDLELIDEDYLEIVNRCWSKFYSCVLQYHLNGSRPLGLLLLPDVSGIVLLKKSSFSLLRPMEPLEYLMFCNDKSYTARFNSLPILSQDDNACQDVINLLSVLVIIEEHLSDTFKSAFEKELYHLKSPENVIETLIPKLLFQSDLRFSDFDFQAELQHRLGSVKDLPNAMLIILEILTYTTEFFNGFETNDSKHFFGSQLGISTISEIVTQITVLRFSVCRNLLILQQLTLLRSELFESQCLHSIISTIIPRTVVLTQAYYVALWVCESNASVTPSQALLDCSSQRLSLLKLTKDRSNNGQRQHRSYSVLELFIEYVSKHHMFNSVNDEKEETFLSFWHGELLSRANLVIQLIWPICNNFIFPDWLLSSYQFLLVQEYVRLLSNWCEWNGASREFILAISLLEMGESQKACDCFLKASNGIILDQYLTQLCFDNIVVTESNALIQFYLKLIEIFEQHNASDCIIELAMAAITLATRDEPNLPTLHSIIFAQHLALGHHSEAYNYLNNNPDAARRADCLRQLVVTLFERKKLIELVSFPYIDMYEELENIMETRARSIDLLDNDYYNFLYSFHMNKGNVRKAASIMYEQAMRFSQDFSKLNISKQTTSLLASINALSLVNEKYQWIVRPFIGHNAPVDFESRFSDSANYNRTSELKIRKKFEVLELKDIKNEYVISEAKLKLIKINTSISLSEQLNSSELISMLINSDLHFDALTVCECLKLCKSSVFEDLTSKCITEKRDLLSRNWFNIDKISDNSASSVSTVNLFWYLLRHLVKIHEKDGQSILHKVVAQKLFHHAAFLPKWLLYSYMKRNPAELLRLMIQMGRLEEASYFSLEYLEAILGKGKEFFGLDVPLLALAQPVYCPFNMFEILLIELKYASQNDSSYLKVYELLQSAVDNYLEISQRVSVDMIKIKSLH